MLASADQALIDRDPGLPGLRHLLDPDALTRLVAEHTRQPCRVVPGRLRYKPRTSCVLSFDLHTHREGAPVVVSGVAKAYTAETAAKADKTLGRLDPRDILAVDRPTRVVVTTLAGDRDLPAVRRLVDDETRPSLLRRVLPGRDGIAGGTLRTLRHNPERRWVGTLDVGTERIVLRAFPGAAAPRHIKAYSRLENQTPSTPALLGSSRRHGLLAVSWAPGQPLHASSPERWFHAAGVALAQLHGGRKPRLEVATPDDHAGRQRRAAAQLAWLVPAMHAEIEELHTLLDSRLRLVESRTSLLHGDLSADQVVFDEPDSATLIDLDAACLGHRAQDLGSLWAAALAEAGTPEEQREATTKVNALLAGYDSVLALPPRAVVELFRDSQLVRRAAEAFRTRLPDWPDHVDRVLALARRGAETSGGHSPW